MQLLKGKAAVITGAGNGIGCAIARTFIEHGAHVLGIDLSEPPLLETSDGTGTFSFVRGDITAEETLADLVGAIGRNARGLSILVNNAAILGPTGRIEETSERDWERVLRINLLGAARLAARLLPFLRGACDARIINVGSVNSLYASRMSGPYVASKHAVLGLTRTQAVEYGRIGITANCLLPGAVDTEMFRSGDADGEFRRYIESRCPIGRLAQPREIAAAALFLASPLSSYINGHALLADGGLTAGV